jgi:hypothetical protein
MVNVGLNNNVPNLQLLNVGAQIHADASIFRTKAVRFGSNAPGAPKIVLTGGIHAREWIAAEMAYLTAEYLIKNYSTAPVGQYQTELSNLINSRNIYIIPMLNPAGNSYSVRSANADSQYWRKNRKNLTYAPAFWQNALNHAPFTNVGLGAVATDVEYDVPEFGTANTRTQTIDTTAAVWGVDCNRNCNTPNWGHETVNSTGLNMQQGNPTLPSYFGTNFGSETEIQNLVAMLHGAGNVAASVDYHCYGELIIIPTESAVSEGHRRLGQALRLLIENNGSAPYTLGTPMQTVHYHALSSVMDYMTHRHNSRAFTVEMDPDLSPPNPQAKFQLPEAQIMGVFEKNIRGVLSLLATAGSNPRSFWGGLCCCCCSPWASSVTRFEAWDVDQRGNQLP